jgi:hypothetical protein
MTDPIPFDRRASKIEPELAAQIRAKLGEADAAALNVLESFAAAGKLLSEAKGRIQHGQWETWVRNEIGISPQTATGYMRVADRHALLQSLDKPISSMRQALDAIRAAEMEAGTFRPRGGDRVHVLGEVRGVPSHAPLRPAPATTEVPYRRTATTHSLDAPYYRINEATGEREGPYHSHSDPAPSPRRQAQLDHVVADVVAAVAPPKSSAPVADAWMERKWDEFAGEWLRATDEARASFVDVAWGDPVLQALYRACQAYDQAHSEPAEGRLH